MVKFKLDEVLKSKNMSRYRLEKLTGIDSNTVNRIYKNQTSAIKLEILEKIVLATECNIQDLIVIETDADKE